jgi:hypothetical protein
MVNPAKSLRVNHIGFQATPEQARTQAKQRGTLKTHVYSHAGKIGAYL